MEGEKIGDNEYKNYILFYNGHALAKIGDYDYVMIDKKGKEIKLKTDIYKINDSIGDNVIISDREEEAEDNGKFTDPSIVDTDSVEVVDSVDIDYD